MAISAQMEGGAFVRLVVQPQMTCVTLAQFSRNYWAEYNSDESSSCYCGIIKIDQT